MGLMLTAAPRGDVETRAAEPASAYLRGMFWCFVWRFDGALLEIKHKGVVIKPRVRVAGGRFA